MQDSNVLYLTTVPKGPVLKLAQNIQAYLADTYKIYKGDKPPLHMTIEVINYKTKQDLSLLFAELNRICSQHRKFNVLAKGFSCFGSPYKSVNIHVESSKELLSLSNHINEGLRSKGFKVREAVENWDFHITLVSTAFASRQWSDEEFRQTCAILKNYDFEEQFEVKKLQLWYPWYKPKLEIAAEFKLK